MCWLVDCFLLLQLTLRRVMDTAKQYTKSGNLNEFSMVLLNNTLSLPLGIFLILVFSEVDYLLSTWVFSHILPVKSLCASHVFIFLSEAMLCHRLKRIIKITPYVYLLLCAWFSLYNLNRSRISKYVLLCQNCLLCWFQKVKSYPFYFHFAILIIKQ